MRTRPIWTVLTALLTALALAPAAAEGSGLVSGVIVDGLTGQPVRGATVTVEGAGVELTSDIGGSFRADVPAATYSVVVSKEGFDPQRITGVVVTEGEVADFAVVLLPSAGGEESLDGTGTLTGEAAFAGEITVVADAVRSTEAALLAERKSAAAISDSIGREEISKTSGGDAAAILQRVVGLSLQDDKYVFVRGLGERYSQTSLNGSRLPTTEFDKKVIPLDLFPARLLEKVNVSKSYSPDQPGDFAAGLVQLETRDFPLEPTLEVTLGMTADSTTTGEPFGQYAGGLSFTGSGGQSLPAAIPSDRVTRSSPFTPGGYSPDQLEVFGESFAGEWTARGTAPDWVGSSFDDAPYAPNMALSYGGTHGIFGVVVSATHAQGYDRRDENRKWYTQSAGGLELANDYDFTTDAETVRRGLVANLALRPSPNHTLELRSITTGDSRSESRYFEGYNDDQSTDLRNYRVRYQEETIASSQLTGEHYFASVGSSGALLEWRGSLGEATNQENLRESLYRNDAGRYVLTDESQSAFLLFNDLTDDVLEGGVDWTQFLSSARLYGQLKGGVALSSRERDFASRRFRFNHRNTTAFDMTLLPDQLLIPDNIRPTGFEIREETRTTDTYEASHDVGAAYAMADLTLGKWRWIAGLRGERSEQQVRTFDPFNPNAPEVLTTLDDTDLMPALSVVYLLSDRTNLRAAASQNVNRPEFRELAPFEFTDVVGGQAALGNPNLTSATITSFDLRWEWFPSSFGVVAASVFYKDFTDPIERTLELAVELRSTWRNVDSAHNYGAELELRRDLGFISAALEPVNVQLNYTYVDSQIDIGDDDQVVTNTQRALVGQPDHIVNAVLEWTPPRWGTTLRLLYNFTGEKVYEAGAFGIPDVIEDASSTVDLILRQDLAFLVEGLSLKLAGTNLTNEEYRLFGGREVTYSRGRGVGVSLSYTGF